MSSTDPHPGSGTDPGAAAQLGTDLGPGTGTSAASGTSPASGTDPAGTGLHPGTKPGAAQPGAQSGKRRPLALRVLTEPLRLRSLGELGYAILAFPLATLLTVAFGAGFLVSVPLTVTVIGLPMLACVILGGRYQGGIHRGMARGLLREEVEGPRPFRPKPGAFGWLASGLGHVEGWRGLAYLVAKVPASFAAMAAAWLTWGMGLMFLAYPVWRGIADPTNTDEQGRVHHSGINFGGNYVDTWPEVLGIALLGLALVLIAPWIVRLIVRLDVWLMRALLGPTKTSERVRDLEETRAIAVDDSAARLRRIERDLHDGAQARIVALAMHLSQAQEQLDADSAAADERPMDVDKARAHVDSALGNARIAITELRDLARGIHPPVLDQGLDAALATLTAGSAVPVRLHTRIDPRPPAALESIAYFCAAELLANATRHGGATEIAVDAVRAGDTLTVRVRDNGSGGARTREGGGLAGLAERVRTVDGTLDVTSPPGGPTVVTVELPVRA